MAGFIGSPQMNFFDVKLEKEGQDVVAKFGNNKIKIALDINRLHFFDKETEKTILNK